MSIAAAVRKGNDIAIAADSLSTFGSHRVPVENHSVVKIRQVGAAYMATTGWGIYEDILDDYISGRRGTSLADKRSIFAFFQHLWRDLHEHYTLVKDQCDEESDSPFGNLDASFLIVNPTGIFMVSSDTSITRFEQYYAVGSGADFALGSILALYDTPMSAEDLAIKGVEAGIAFDTGCGGRIDVRSLKFHA